MSNFPATPHINVQNEIGFGKTVLMPGDPLRSKFIAENFLENPVLVNNVRGVHGYTGYYKGVKVSVMASGMGMPAIGIYSHELFNFFGVENIIRVGSAGSIQDHINLYDLVIAQGACTDSNFVHQFHFPGTFAPIADFTLLSEAVKAAEANGATYHVGNVNSSDVFRSGYAVQPEEDGRHGTGDGSRCSVYERRPLRQAWSVHLHHFRSHPQGCGDHRRRTPDRFHHHDESGPGRSRGHGE